METFMLFAGLAEFLIGRWKKPLGPGRTELLPGVEELVLGLKRIFNRDGSLLDLLKGADTVKDLTSHADKIEEAIKTFQRSIGALKVDGILGKKTLSDLLTLIGCDKNGVTPSTKNLLDSVKSVLDELKTKRGETWYFYWVKELPQIPGASADILLENAWESWRQVARVKSQRVPDQDQANVVIGTRDLQGNVLGEANLGRPPSTHVLELDMDSTRSWTPALFEGAICHEIGHILGLEHAVGPGKLMSEFIPPGTTAPTQADVQAVEALPWIGPQIETAPITIRPDVPGFPT